MKKELQNKNAFVPLFYSSLRAIKLKIETNISSIDRQLRRDKLNESVEIKNFFINDKNNRAKMSASRRPVILLMLLK